MSNMTCADFAKYMVDNIGRATLANAFNITDKFVSKTYDFAEFLQYVDDYVSEKLTSCKDKIVYYKISIATNKARTMVSSKNKYNLTMIVDDFVEAVWEAVNGSKGA